MLYLVGVGGLAAVRGRLFHLPDRGFLIFFASIILRRIVVCGDGARREDSFAGKGGGFRRTAEHSVSHAFAQPTRTVRCSTSGLYSVFDEARESLVHVSAHATVLQGSRARNLDAQGGKNPAAGRHVSHSLRLALASTYRVAGNMRAREVA
jgi:hypothetical protein